MVEFHSCKVDEEIVLLSDELIPLDKCMEEIHGVGACFLCNLEQHKQYVFDTVAYLPIDIEEVIRKFPIINRDGIVV